MALLSGALEKMLPSVIMVLAAQGNGEFDYAKDVAIANDGNLYVADASNHRIQVLDENGTYIRKFSSQGTAPGHINSLLMDFIRNSTLLISDNARLHWFDSNGNFIKRIREDTSLEPRQSLSVSLMKHYYSANRHGPNNNNYPFEFLLFSRFGDFSNGFLSTIVTQLSLCLMVIS